MKTNNISNNDLNNCQSEPIHIPGSIQPHGVLLVLDEPNLTIIQASENTAFFFDKEAERLRGQNLGTLFSSVTVNEIQTRLGSEKLASINPFRIEWREQIFDAIFHRSDGGLVMEMEPRQTKAGQSDENILRAAVAELSAATTMEELESKTVKVIADISGFDRVLLYKFDSDWAGLVLAESVKPGMRSYLAHRFPASDIPEQARRLYTVNWVRQIVTNDYRPVPLVPPLNPKTGRPLDMSHATLRSVSPIHLQYMKNMGDCSASMSVSLINESKLWGLIAMHHQTPKFTPYRIRNLCELIGIFYSHQILYFESQAYIRRREKLKGVSKYLIEKFSENSDVFKTIFSNAKDILALGNASGAAVKLRGTLQLIGKTPTESQISDLMKWAIQTEPTGIFVSDHLAAQYPEAENFRDSSAGIMATTITRENGDYIVWFRPEIRQTIAWSGDPKSAGTPELKKGLSPRHSFETYREEITGRSAPWNKLEVDAIAEFRRALMAEELKTLTTELSRSNEDLTRFAYFASHDLQAPLRHVSSFAALLVAKYKGSADTEALKWLGYIATGTADMKSLILNLLEYSRVQKSNKNPELVNLNEIVDALITLLRTNDPSCRITRTELPKVYADKFQLRQLFQNLIQNGMKFRKPDQPNEIEISCRESKREWTFCVKDNGIGIEERFFPKIFQLFQRLNSRANYEGSGIGLSICQRVVEFHGGRIWVESEFGRGSSFFFTIPY